MRKITFCNELGKICSEIESANSFNGKSNKSRILYFKIKMLHKPLSFRRNVSLVKKWQQPDSTTYQMFLRNISDLSKKAQNRFILRFYILLEMIFLCPNLLSLLLPFLPPNNKSSYRKRSSNQTNQTPNYFASKSKENSCV